MLTENPDARYDALAARDPRFDGVFFVGVSTTGIYCRPICPAKTPGRTRCTFFETADLARRLKQRLIERFGSLGGNLTLGLNTKPSGALVGGLPLELWTLARSEGAAGDDYFAVPAV